MEKALDKVCESGSVKVLDIVVMWCKDFLNQKRLDPAVRTGILSLFSQYYNKVSAVLDKGHKRLLKIQENNNEHFIARGAVSEDREEKYNSGMSLLTIPSS